MNDYEETWAWLESLGFFRGDAICSWDVVSIGAIKGRIMMCRHLIHAR